MSEFEWPCARHILMDICTIIVLLKKLLDHLGHFHGSLNRIWYYKVYLDFIYQFTFPRKEVGIGCVECSCIVLSDRHCVETDLSHGFELQLSILCTVCIVWLGMVQGHADSGWVIVEQRIAWCSGWVCSCAALMVSSAWLLDW